MAKKQQQPQSANGTTKTKTKPPAAPVVVKPVETAPTATIAQPPAQLDYIHEMLRPLAVPIETLNFDPSNARRHPERNLQTIISSLSQFGQDQPLVVQKQGMIVRKGNGRLTAAKHLGWSHVAVVLVDENDVESVCRAIADNRAGELAEWDFQALSSLFVALNKTGLDLSTLGFLPHETEPLLNADWNPPPITEEGFDEKDGKPEEHNEKSIKMTVEQRLIFENACRIARANFGQELVEGEFVAFMSQRYIDEEETIASENAQATSTTSQGKASQGATSTATATAS